MLSEFEKFAGFKVLYFFLSNPKTELHIQGIAKKLKIAAGTAGHYCGVFAGDGLLNEKKTANTKVFSLNNESAFARELKKTFALLLFKEAGIERIAKGNASLAVFGSFANGSFDENSDLDLIIIGNGNDADKDLALRLEKAIGRQVQLTVMPYFEWEKRKKRKDAFAVEVLKNHFLIKGAEL